jgi:chromosome transmission fidelity protein 1
MEVRLAKIRAKEMAQKERYLKGDPDPKRRRVENKVKRGEGDDEEQFVLDDYDSDQEGASSGPKGGTAIGLSAETITLMKKLGMGIGPAEEEEQEVEDEIKVYYLFMRTWT